MHENRNTQLPSHSIIQARIEVMMLQGDMWRMTGMTHGMTPPEEKY